jgi:hypothetical protein
VSDPPPQIVVPESAEAQLVHAVREVVPVIFSELRQQRADEDASMLERDKVREAGEAHRATLAAAQDTRRETTIRWVSGALVIGVFAVIGVMAWRGKAPDLAQVLPTLGLLIGFLYMLAERKKQPPTKPPSDDA